MALYTSFTSSKAASSLNAKVEACRVAISAFLWRCCSLSSSSGGSSIFTRCHSQVGVLFLRQLQLLLFSQVGEALFLSHYAPVHCWGLIEARDQKPSALPHIV